MTCSLVLPKTYPLHLVCPASQRSNKVFMPFTFIKISLSQRKHIFINNKRKIFWQFLSYFVVWNKVSLCSQSDLELNPWTRVDPLTSKCWGSEQEPPFWLTFREHIISKVLSSLVESIQQLISLYWRPAWSINEAWIPCYYFQKPLDIALNITG